VSDPVQENPYESCPALFGWHPWTVRSCAQALAALTEGAVK
jgi:hypothetical protein